jgi:hypothetical protein
MSPAAHNLLLRPLPSCVWLQAGCAIMLGGSLWRLLGQLNFPE